MNTLFLEGLIFSTLAIGTIVLVAWWLYASPLKAPVAAARPISSRTALTLALLIGVAAILISIGAYWDASEHVVTGIVPGGDDFLWPPHLMIYAGFLLAFVIAMGGFLALAVPNLGRGVRDPRRWVRRNPYIGAAALAAGYGLFSIPGDAIWHELFGIDLTAWSPPHVFLMLASAATPLCAIGLLLQSRPRRPGRSDWRSLAVLFLLALVLSEIYLIAVMEWELARISRYVAARPLWLYPTLIGGIAFFVLVLARRLAPAPWTATVTALLYFAWRMGASALAAAISGAPPRLTLVFVLGAVLLDLAARRTQRRGVPRALMEAGAFAIGYGAVALPTIAFFLRSTLPHFGLMDHLLTLLATFAIGVAFGPLARRTGDWLLHHRVEEEERQTPAPIPHPVPVPLE